MQLGLVDKIGDLDDAISAAANYADLTDFKTVSYTKDLDPFEMFIAELLKNLDININISNHGKMFLNFLNKQYNFIDTNKNINVALYCFECEYLYSK